MPPICNSTEKELWNELYGILNEVTKQCPKSCSLFEYSGKIRSLLGYLPLEEKFKLIMPFCQTICKFKKNTWFMTITLLLDRLEALWDFLLDFHF